MMKGGEKKMDRHERMLDLAKREALKSSVRHQIGCVVTYKGYILAVGHNKTKSHPLQKTYNAFRFSEDTNHSIHAEVDALVQVAKRPIDFSKVTVYTYRPCKSRKSGMARPCPSCMAYIKQLGIKKLCYSTDEGYACETLVY